MKICFITGNYPPKLCGVGDYTYFLAEELAQRGHVVHVITLTSDDSEKGPTVKHIVHRINKWSIAEIPKILTILREHSPDVLNIQYVPHAYHPRSFTFTINILPLILRVIRKNIKIVITIHECHLPWLPSLKGSLMSLWHRIMLFLICTFSHEIVVTTKQWNRLLKRVLVFKKTEWVPVGSNIPMAEFPEEEKKSLKNKILNGIQDCILITSFGTLHESKDLNTIINVLKTLREKYKIKFIWIGGKGIKEKLREDFDKKFKENKIDAEFTGEIGRAEIYKYLSISDIFLQPYTQGVTTNRGSLIAALGIGVPLVTTYSDNTDECFKDGKVILLVPAGDDKEIMNLLTSLINDRKLMIEIGQKEKDLFNKFFSWRSIADNLIRVFSENKS